MTQNRREVVPANEAVYDEWLAKPSWTLPEAACLIVGLDPSKIFHPCEGFPAEEYGNVIDTLRRAVGEPGKQGLGPISGKDAGDWRFKPRGVVRTAVYYKLEVSGLLLNRAKIAETPSDTSHGNADRYAEQRKEILMAGLAALAYRPDEFRTKEGRLINKDLAEFLEESWPGEGAPQKAEAMAKLFGEVLKFGKWTDTKSTENI
jgi:hypothetical protein